MECALWKADMHAKLRMKVGTIQRQKSKDKLILNADFPHLSVTWGGRVDGRTLFPLGGFLLVKKKIFSQLFDAPFIRMAVPSGTSPLLEIKAPAVIV